MARYAESVRSLGWWPIRTLSLTRHARRYPTPIDERNPLYARTMEERLDSGAFKIHWPLSDNVTTYRAGRDYEIVRRAPCRFHFLCRTCESNPRSYGVAMNGRFDSGWIHPWEPGVRCPHCLFGERLPRRRIIETMEEEIGSCIEPVRYGAAAVLERLIGGPLVTQDGDR